MNNSRPWHLVALLAATATAGYICRVNIATAGALVMDEFHLSQVDMGRVFSSFLLGYALFQIPSGALADRFGTRKILSIAVWLWVIFTVLQSLVGWSDWGISASTVLFIFITLRFMLGVTASPMYPAAALGVSRWVPSTYQGRANGIVIGSVGLGSAIAPPLVSYVMINWGWQMALAISSLPALIIALIWQKAKTPSFSLTKIEENSETESGSRINNTSFYLLSISYGLQGYVGYIFVSWFYLYLVQVRQFSLLSGAWMSSLPWVLSIISIPLGGYVSDKLITGRLGSLWGSRIVPMVGMGMSGILISVGAHTSSAIVAAITLAFATAFVLCVEGPFWGMMTSIAGKRSGTAGGIMNMGSNFGGLISPVLTPWIASYLGWEFALHIAAVFSIVAALLWLGVKPNTSDSREDF